MRLTTSLLLTLLLALGVACGIKGPPRPPLEEPARPATTPPLVDAPDAGCCRSPK